MPEKRESWWTPEARHDAVKAYLRAKYTGHMATVMEYIDEAENQEGEEYWDQFEGHLDELIADVELYIKHAEAGEPNFFKGPGTPEGD